MHDVTSFGGVVLVWGLVGTAALLGRHVARWIRVPAPAVFLLAAALAANFIKALRTAVDLHVVENVVTLALIVILFDGGLHLGRRRFREAAVPIVALGVLGTFATTALIAVVSHTIFGLDWKILRGARSRVGTHRPRRRLLRTCKQRTNQAGRRRSSKANRASTTRPASRCCLASSTWPTHKHGSIAAVFGNFAISDGGGMRLRRRRRRGPAVVAQHSASGRQCTTTVACTGRNPCSIRLSDGRARLWIPRGTDRRHRDRRRVSDEAPAVESFHATLASLGEVVAFVMLGITVRLHTVLEHHAWLIGLGIFGLLTLVLRPVVCVPLLTALKLRPPRDHVHRLGRPEGSRADPARGARRQRRGAGRRAALRDRVRGRRRCLSSSRAARWRGWPAGSASAYDSPGQD